MTAAAAALDALKSAAKEARNIMEPSIACAHAGVTTGEWGTALREIYGEKVRLVPHGQRRPFLRRMGVGAAGVDLAAEIAALAEARALWSRFGV